MVAMYARLDTGHGEDGSFLPKVNPELYGLTLDDVTGITADAVPLGTSVQERMAPDANVEEKLAAGATTEAEVAGGMTEKPISTGAEKLAEEGGGQPGDQLGDTSVLGEPDAKASAEDDSVATDALLSKTALRAMSKEDLVAYAEKRNIDCEGANKEEIIAALYGE